MKKRMIILTALALCLMVALLGCNSTGGNPPSTSPPSNSGDQGAASSNPAESTGNSSGADTYFKMLGKDTYHMKAKMSSNGMEIVMETFMKNGRVASITEGKDVSSRVIIRDDKMYVIMDESKTISVIDAPASSSGSGDMQGTIDTEGMQHSGSGTAEFDGKNLPYEEYSDNTGVTKAQFFMEGGKLAGIRNISQSYTADMVILQLDENVPDSVFEIPSDYEIKKS